MTISNNKLLVGAAGAGGGAGLDVDEVFNITLYNGNNTTNNIVNGIDFSGEDGMLWIKNRTDGGGPHTIYDTVRGNNSGLRTNTNGDAETGTNNSQDLTAFNNNGFSLGTGWAENVNYSDKPYCAWSFRKAENFFDVQTYTGSGENGQTINHDLGVAPGMVWVKSLDANANWYVYHRSLGSGEHLKLNNTSEVSTDSNYEIGKATATATQFSIDTGSDIDYNGHTYVAYFFAHNNDDGGFGPNADQDIIKCGKYTGDGGTAGTEINLGFEPQFLFIRGISSADNWYLVDSMRGLSHHPNVSNDVNLYVNEPAAESAIGLVDLTSTGFKTTLYSNANVNTREYIYMAIRRGPMSEPSDVDDVFSVNIRGTGDSPNNVWPIGFNADMNINTKTSGATRYLFARGTAMKSLAIDGTSQAGDAADSTFFSSKTNTLDANTNWWGTSTNVISWSWKRAPKYFDHLAYTGNGTSGRSLTHNLGVAPEMTWIKRMDSAANWRVNIAALGTDGSDSPVLRLNLTNASEDDNGSYYGNNNSGGYSAPTATALTLGGSSDVNGDGSYYSAFLFATLAGISKVGTYVGNATNDRVIDCGFSSGASFVLIKETDNNSYWFVYDNVRGITTGTTDPAIYLNQNDAQASESGTQAIQPDNSGFKISSISSLNNNDGIFIFYAVAA